MKLAHYLHIAPRTLFAAQGIATLVGALVQCGVTVFMITRIDGVCTPEAEGNFTCPHGRVTYSSSLIWGRSRTLTTTDLQPQSVCTTSARKDSDQLQGVVGPGRLFSPGQTYGNLLWFLLVGPIVVVVTYLLGRRWKSVHYVSWPVAFGAMSLVPPATGVSFSSWWVINAFFNGLLRRRKPAWWSKYSKSPRSLRLYRNCPADLHRLCPLCRSRLRCRGVNRGHLFLYSPPSRAVELVGEHCVY